VRVSQPVIEHVRDVVVPIPDTLAEFEHIYPVRGQGGTDDDNWR
jgi:hypothetical protein